MPNPTTVKWIASITSAVAVLATTLTAGSLYAQSEAEHRSELIASIKADVLAAADNASTIFEDGLSISGMAGYGEGGVCVFSEDPSEEATCVDIATTDEDTFISVVNNPDGEGFVVYATNDVFGSPVFEEDSSFYIIYRSATQDLLVANGSGQPKA